MGGNKTRRQEVAQRYRDWLWEQLDEQGWTPADIIRRSGLSKQQVTPILEGSASQPSAAQIAGFARALQKEPTKIFEELGFWSGEGQVQPKELHDLYYSLDFIQRRALVRIGATLKTAQSEYAVLMRGPGRPTRARVTDLQADSDAQQEEQGEELADAAFSNEEESRGMHDESQPDTPA